MITKQQIEDLLQVDTGGWPVVSFYLCIDGRERSVREYVERTHQLVRVARTEIDDRDLSHEARRAVSEDLERVVRFIGAELERGNNKGVTLFACSAGGLWRSFLLPCRVPDQVRIADRPYIRPLAMLLSECPAGGVVLIDREKARFARLQDGRLVECDEIKDVVHSPIHPSSWHGLADKRIEGHIDNQVQNHLKHAAGVLEEMVEREHLDRVIVLGTAQMLPEFLRTLPRHLLARVVGREDHVPVDLPADEVLPRVERILSEVKHHEDDKVMRRVYDAAYPGGLGSVGLEETLQALASKAVDKLVIDRDLQGMGYACRRCGRLFGKYGACPDCHAPEPQVVDDIVEEAIEIAVRQGADVEFVTASPAWAKSGGIGALLRFHPSQAAEESASLTTAAMVSS